MLTFYDDSIFSPELLLVETGFKYNKNDKLVFTTTISFDLIMALYAIGWLNGGVDPESINNPLDKAPPRRNP